MNANLEGPTQTGTHRRIARWSGAALLLLLPLLAGADWSGMDYVFAGGLLFGALGAYELVARTSGSTVYRAGAGLGALATLLLLWVNGAVGITDGPADLAFFLLVPAAAIVGVLGARFEARAMARAMFATALVVLLIAAGALAVGVVPAANSAVEVLGIAAFFAVPFAGSGLLFLRAAEEAGAERAA